MTITQYRALLTAFANSVLSDESVKELRSFEDADACINWLFMNRQQDAARALNAHIKQ